MTFRERIRRRLCDFWWRFYHGRLSGRFSVPATGLRPQHLVVVLPPEFHDFDVALHILTPLVERTHPRQTTVLVRENYRTWLSGDLGARFLTFDPAVHNWLGFPKAPMLRRVEELTADVAVDLTPSFDPFTAALTAATGAPLRISLDIEHRNTFFNFFLQIESGKSLAERYEVLLRYV